ncbi:MAG: sugar ABC transporter substrate-binding protein [Ilumatobacteraceae bacterium]
MKHTRRVRVTALVITAAAAIAACSSDDTTSSTSAAATTAAPTTAASTPASASADTTAATTDAGTSGSDTSQGGMPEGAVEVKITGDLAALKGVTAGIANLAPVPGAERWSMPLQACLEANGATVDYQDVGGDPTKLPALLDGWLATETKAVFNIGIDMSGQESVIAKFSAANVPFVTWGAGAPAGVVALDANQVEDGRIIARYIIEQLGGQGDVFLVNANNPALQSREDGIKEVFAAAPGIKLTVGGEALGFTAESAQKSTESALLANPEIKAIIGGFGSLGVGAATAVDAAGSDAIVVSMNGDPEEYAAIRAGGSFKATVADGHEFGGQAACEIASSMLAGNPAPGDPSKPILTTSVLVTADNVPADGESESTPRLFYQLS